MAELLKEQPNTFNVLSWNMFLDKTRAKNQLIRHQSDRLPVFIDTLRAFPGSLDVVALQEAGREEWVNNGKALARALGFRASYFFQHNLPKHEGAPRGRYGEHLGVFGELVSEAEAFDIGDNRMAVRTNVESEVIVNSHLRQGVKNESSRVKSAENILNNVANDERVVLTLDTNEHWLGPARRLLHSEGFQSVSVLTHKRRPVTFPTPDYRDMKYGSNPIIRALPGIALDEIYVRGLKVIAAGRLSEVPVTLETVYDDEGNILVLPSGASDHYGLWAQLSRN